MTFEISDAVVIERIVVVSITIVLFGIVSIGGLSLWRYLATKSRDKMSAAE